MLTLREFEERFTTLSNHIQEAETALSQGKIISFPALEEEINQLCTAAKAAPPEIAVQLRAPIAQMISTLDELAAKLEDFTAQKKRERNA